MLCTRRVELFHGAIPPGHFAWLGLDGQDRPVRVVEALVPGVTRLELVGARTGRGEGPRLYPTHPSMADPRDMGLALTLRA